MKEKKNLPISEIKLLILQAEEKISEAKEAFASCSKKRKAKKVLDKE